MWNRIGPMDILEPGTKVRVKNRTGVVVGHEVHNATPCGKIVVHTMRMTEKVVTIKRGSFPLPTVTATKDCDEIMMANYSFVDYWKEA